MSKEHDSPVKVDIGAKAELKVNVTAEVPQESTKKIIDTFLDIIRPFSEKRGLKADLLRLQREEVALQVVKMATERLKEEGIDPKPVPNKILVPLLEKASLEEPDDPLVDLWSNLLAHASQNPDVSVNTFSDILSKLGSEQAKLLDIIASPRHRIVPSAILSHDLGMTRALNWQQSHYYAGLKRLHEEKLKLSLDILRSEMDKNDLFYTVHINAETDSYFHEHKIDFEILERQKLIEKFRVDYSNNAVFFYGLTELGIQFLYHVELKVEEI